MGKSGSWCGDVKSRSNVEKSENEIRESLAEAQVVWDDWIS